MTIPYQAFYAWSAITAILMLVTYMIGLSKGYHAKCEERDNRWNQKRTFRDESVRFVDDNGHDIKDKRISGKQNRRTRWNNRHRKPVKKNPFREPRPSKW